MSTRQASLIAAAATVLLYVLIAWAATAVEIPGGTPTAQSSWIRPFRVISAIGFALASLTHLPHAVGQFLAAAGLGAVLGALFTVTRLVLR